MLPAKTRDLMHAAVRLFVACAMALTLAAPAWAQMGRDQAAAAAERQTGGRVLAVERIESSSGPMWRVKVVTPRGEVRVVLIEADDGRSLRNDGRRNGTQGPGAGVRLDRQRGGGWQRNQRPGRGG